MGLGVATLPSLTLGDVRVQGLRPDPSRQALLARLAWTTGEAGCCLLCGSLCGSTRFTNRHGDRGRRSAGKPVLMGAAREQTTTPIPDQGTRESRGLLPVR